MALLYTRTDGEFKCKIVARMGELHLGSILRKRLNSSTRGTEKDDNYCHHTVGKKKGFPLL